MEPSGNLDSHSPNKQNNNPLHVSNRIKVVKKCLDSPFSVYPENEEINGGEITLCVKIYHHTCEARYSRPAHKDGYAQSINHRT